MIILMRIGEQITPKKHGIDILAFKRNDWTTILKANKGLFRAMIDINMDHIVSIFEEKYQMLVKENDLFEINSENGGVEQLQKDNIQINQGIFFWPQWDKFIANCNWSYIKPPSGSTSGEIISWPPLYYKEEKNIFYERELDSMWHIWYEWTTLGDINSSRDVAIFRCAYLYASGYMSTDFSCS